MFYQGEYVDHVLVILRGWAKDVINDEDGREAVLAVRGPGELIGEQGLMTEDQQISTVTALHEVMALSVSRSRFQTFLDSHPAALPKVIRTMSGRIQQSAERIMANGTQDGAIRLAYFILQLAEQSGEPVAEGGVRIPPLSQTELGSCVDTSRETVARALKDWRKQGLVRTSWRETILLNPDGLRKIASSRDY